LENVDAEFKTHGASAGGVKVSLPTEFIKVSNVSKVRLGVSLDDDNPGADTDDDANGDDSKL
jgi:hypothetical protein